MSLTTRLTRRDEPESVPSGYSPERARAQRHLALAVREGVSVEALRDYHLLIACGHASQLYREPRTQEVRAVCLCCPASEGGHPKGPQPGVLRPTQEERTKSVNWLTDRGHGLPAQAVVIENVVRAGTSSATEALVGLPPSVVFGILNLVRASQAAQGGSVQGAQVVGQHVPPAALPPGVADVIETSAEGAHGGAKAREAADQRRIGACKGA